MRKTMAVDILFTGGAVFTGTGEPQRGLAVGVTGDRITHVVESAFVGTLVDEHTQTVDLDGALLSPGFQDAHIHPVGGGVELLQCNLTETESAEEAVATIAAYAAANPDVPWILGAGWSMDHYEGGAPLRGLIDAVVSDRPVFLHSRDHHSAWANTRAIELAGLDASTADPADGRIEREADGAPAGTFHEGAANLFDAVAPAVTPELAYRGLLEAQRALIAFGITGWQDAMIGGSGPGLGAIEAYERAIDEGTLKVHVVGSQWWERDGGLEQVDEMVARRDERVARGITDKFDLGTTKIMVDGVAENFTASMLDAYLDETGHATCNHGISFLGADNLREAVAKLDAAGMQVHMHALGDRAVREGLDALENAAAQNGETDGRHHLAHLQIVAESDTKRFAPLRATANLQALWATHEDQLDTLTLPFMKPELEARQYPFGDLERGGARLAAGSDWPVSSANPLEGIHVAVTRQGQGITAGPLGGDHQRLSLESAFAAYTSGTAYVNHRDHDTGYIRDGYLANLSVISPNPFDLEPAAIATASVRETWIAGERVYSAS